MSDVCIKPGPKFPSTRLLEACYNDIVPNEYADNNDIDTLANLWCREGNFFNYCPLVPINTQ